MTKVCNKRKFWTRTAAWKESIRIKTNGGIYPDEILYQYYCNQCLAWHNSRKNHNEYVKAFNEGKLERIERLLKEGIIK